MNTNTETVTVTQSRDMELKMKVAAAAGNTTTVTKDVAVNTATEETAVLSAEDEKAIAEKEASEAVMAEDTAVGEEVIVAEETGEVAPVEAATEIAEEGVDTSMVVGEATVIAEPAPIFDGKGGDIGFDPGMYNDPMTETGVAEVKDPLLSSWPFVIGISAVVLFVSMALGALLARRKIKKGIELYED